MFVAPQVSSLDIEMAMSLVAQNARGATFPRVQTWLNLDVRSHKGLYKQPTMQIQFIWLLHRHDMIW